MDLWRILSLRPRLASNASLHSFRFLQLILSRRGPLSAYSWLTRNSIGDVHPLSPIEPQRDCHH